MQLYTFFISYKSILFIDKLKKNNRTITFLSF